MIEIAQTGQAGKTSLLFDMHRLRARVFKDRLQWDVHVDGQGLEVDQFDIPEAVYLLYLDSRRRVTGSWRMLSCDGPTMLRDVWPQYLESLPMPVRRDCVEVSRFSIDCLEDSPFQTLQETQKAIGEMFCGLTEFCLRIGIHSVYTLYDDRIAKVIRKIDCIPQMLSEDIPINGVPCRAGVFRTDAAMLDRLRRATGISSPVLSGVDNPPYLVFGKQAGDEEAYHETCRKPA